ncbi:hypothetical protein SASPL_120712 [Salvia splendens]|uniref:Protein mago nashi n=1 Tax=Salvia splendens TaxID=180675 RepID=A0A8X8XRA2_SALSN|nr:hypothetical protein SASPL_120712 [Salvia splendens]
MESPLIFNIKLTIQHVFTSRKTLPFPEASAMADGVDDGEFYLRYYVGHKGKFGHEFLEFEFRPDGKLRYANNSNYKNDTMIRKEIFLTPAVLKECRRIVSDSEIMKEDDNNWPEPDRVGRQELEIVMGNEHISFTTSKIGSLVDVQTSKDPEGLRIFYYLVQMTICSFQYSLVLFGLWTRLLGKILDDQGNVVRRWSHEAIVTISVNALVLSHSHREDMSLHVLFSLA